MFQLLISIEFHETTIGILMVVSYNGSVTMKKLYVKISCVTRGNELLFWYTSGMTKCIYL